MKHFIERVIIFILKKLNVPLLSHAHIQMGISAFHSFQVSGEEQVLKFLKEKNITGGLNLIDVGANNGDYSLLLAQKFEDAHIYSFEPMNDIFEDAKQALSTLKNVKLFNYGLHSEKGKITLYNSLDHHNDQISTSYKEGLVDFYKVENVQEFTIEVNTLDNFCAENNIDIVDFLKIDVEGAEIDVLKGAQRLFKEDKITAIQFEFNDFNVSSRTFFKDFYDTLPGFNFYRISKKGLLFMGKYATVHEIFVYQNILALHNSIDPFKKNVKF
jgi:FkbM family methyltransferase